MIRAKVCLLGASAVGKTSLVTRYVRDTFSDAYRTTIGVAIERKMTQVDHEPVELVVWDLEGEDEFVQMRPRYLRGVSGCLFVADGTRSRTLGVALRLAEEAALATGEVPRVLIVNKTDLTGQWALDDGRLGALAERGWQVVRASARTGQGVEAAFEQLAREIVREGRDVRLPSP